MSNFDFLKAEWPVIHVTACKPSHIWPVIRAGCAGRGGRRHRVRLRLARQARHGGVAAVGVCGCARAAPCRGGLSTRPRYRGGEVVADIWDLRRCVWWVPDFTVERFESRLRELDARLRGGTPFVAHSTRHLIDTRRPTSP